MTSASSTPVLELRQYDASSYRRVVPAIGRLYEDVYGEPPYCEGPDDAADFTAGLPRRASQKDFHLVVAFADGAPIGFSFGHQLPPETRWWEGATTPLPDSVTRETPGRTFAIIELAVSGAYRRRGVAKAMHDLLRADRRQERLTLLVRPEAAPALAAYQRWGYVRVGSIRPWPDAPLYDAMILRLRDIEDVNCLSGCEPSEHEP